MKKIEFSNQVIKDQIAECREDELTDAEIVEALCDALGKYGVKPEQVVSLLIDRPGAAIVGKAISEKDKENSNDKK